MKIYTDGACHLNGYEGSIGGWAFAIVDQNRVIHSKSGKVVGATNNQMEMLAVIKACEYAVTNIYSQLENDNLDDLKNDNDNISFQVITDSAYIHNCLLEGWWIKWQANNWINSKKEPVKNKELWERLIPFFTNAIFSFEHVKAHQKENGDQYNELVDKMAVAARKE